MKLSIAVASGDPITEYPYVILFCAPPPPRKAYGKSIFALADGADIIPPAAFLSYIATIAPTAYIAAFCKPYVAFLLWYSGKNDRRFLRAKVRKPP